MVRIFLMQLRDSGCGRSVIELKLKVIIARER